MGRKNKQNNEVKADEHIVAQAYTSIWNNPKCAGACFVSFNHSFFAAVGTKWMCSHEYLFNEIFALAALSLFSSVPFPLTRAAYICRI